MKSKAGAKEKPSDVTTESRVTRSMLAKSSTGTKTKSKAGAKQKGSAVITERAAAGKRPAVITERAAAAGKRPAKSKVTDEKLTKIGKRSRR